MGQIQISIAMPSFNQVEFIESAIESVFQQNYDPVELIVADGGSTDGTVEVLQRLSESNAKIIWDSTPDAGPAAAIVRAFSRARGQLIGWLNSDDVYANGTFDAVVDAFRREQDWIMCYGHGEHIDEAGNSLGRYPTLRPERGLAAFENGCYICQPTMFMKATAIQLLGPLDAGLKTAFDYDYWMRAFKAFPGRIGFLDQVLAYSRLHQNCITVRMRETVALEGLKLGRRHLQQASVHWAVTYLEELRRTFDVESEEFRDAAKAFLAQANEFLEARDAQTLRMTLGA